MAETVFIIDLRFERDVVQARQRAREIAALLGFDHQEQIRIATAASEIARNAFRYAKGGRVTYSAVLEHPQSLQIEIIDQGSGIQSLDSILEGRYRSHTGMGMGIVGTRRLMDRFDIQTSDKGTRVLFAKQLPPSAPNLTLGSIRKVREEINRRSPEDPYEEIQQQNAEMMKTLSELRSRQEELDRLNRELEDTNRGVVALYAELEDRADYLRRTAELKSAFMSNMSHEFRTPLNSIISLTRMLGESSAPALSDEQQLEVGYIRNSARDLLELVNDLLDLAKIEAGKLQVRPRPFEVSELFGALRGMLKPLLSETSMSLVFEEPEGIPTLFTDEGKLSQILRNLISNAIKFTPKGEVRISAALEGEDHICFTVADTGIGIAEADIENIFQEFRQVDNDLQKKYRGTGLGLPLSRNLATILGGTITVKSQPGLGSTFSVSILREYVSETRAPEAAQDVPIDPRKLTVLVMEDNHETRYLYQSMLEKTQFQMIGVNNSAEARKFLEKQMPDVVVCDLLIGKEMELAFIHELRNSAGMANIPIVAISILPEENAALSAGADAFLQKPVQKEMFVNLLHRLTNRERAGKILLIDDQEVARYLLRQFIPEDVYEVTEARSGREGLAIARAKKPDLIFLDLKMADLDGYNLLVALKQDAQTQSIPIVVHTSQPLTEVRRAQLAGAMAILPKSALGEDNAEQVVASLLERAGLIQSPRANHV